MVPDEVAREAFSEGRPGLALRVVPPAPGIQALSHALKSQQVGDLRSAASGYRNALGHPGQGRWRGAARYNLVLLESGLGNSYWGHLEHLRGSSRIERRGAAQALWELRRTAVGRPALDDLRVYLAAFADVLDPSTRAAAEIEIAWSLWHLACPTRARIEGLCATRTPVRWKDCGRPQDLEVLEIVARDPVLAREAQAFARVALRRGLRALRQGSASRVLPDTIARARLLLVEPELEALIRQRSPKSVEIQVDEWKRNSGVVKWELEVGVQAAAARRDRARVAAFYRRKTQALDTLVKRYRNITQGGTPSTLFAVLLRAAQAIESTELELRYLAGEAREELEYVDASCCQIGVVDVLSRVSVQLLERCVDLADEYDYTDPWVEICVAKLGRAPREYDGSGKRSIVDR